MSKHTPGPWVVDCNQFGTMPTAQCIVRSVGDNGVSDRKQGIMVVGVGDCGWDDCDGPSLSMANALLIAAAPDLLAACKGLRAVIHDYMTHAEQRECVAYIEAADKAIAAAGGAQ